MSIYVMPEAPEKLPEPPAGALVMRLKIEKIEDIENEHGPGELLLPTLPASSSISE